MLSGCQFLPSSDYSFRHFFFRLRPDSTLSAQARQLTAGVRTRVASDDSSVLFPPVQLRSHALHRTLGGAVGAKVITAAILLPTACVLSRRCVCIRITGVPADPLSKQR